MTIINTLRLYAVKSALIVLGICVLLFSIDRETKGLSDLLNPGNLFALVLYFMPMYLLSYLIYAAFQKRGIKNSAAWALCIGIPVGLTLVMITLSWAMGRL